MVTKHLVLVFELVLEHLEHHELVLTPYSYPDPKQTTHCI